MEGAVANLADVSPLAAFKPLVSLDFPTENDAIRGFRQAEADRRENAAADRLQTTFDQDQRASAITARRLAAGLSGAGSGGPGMAGQPTPTTSASIATAPPSTAVTSQELDAPAGGAGLSPDAVGKGPAPTSNLARVRADAAPAGLGMSSSRVDTTGLYRQLSGDLANAGLGTKALDALGKSSAAYDAETEREKAVYTAYAKGDIATGDALAARGGVRVPDSVRMDARLAKAALFVEHAYKDDKAAGTKFYAQIHDALTNDPSADYNTVAIQALRDNMPKAKKPVGAAAFGTYDENTGQPIWVAPKNERPATYGQPIPIEQTNPDGTKSTRLYQFSSRGGAPQLVDVGEGASLAPKAGAAGRSSVFQQKQSAWLQLHPEDQQGALEFASGRRQMGLPDQQKAATQIATSELTKGQLAPPSPGAIQKRAEEIMRGWTGQGGTAAPAAAAGAASAGGAAPAGSVNLKPSSPGEVVAPLPDVAPQSAIPPDADRVKADFKAGRITRDEAMSKLKQLGAVD